MAMSSWVLMKCIGKAVMKGLVRSIPFGDIAVEIADDIYDEWSKEKDEGERTVELQQLVHAFGDEVRAEIRAVVKEVADEKSAAVQEQIATYLSLVPAAIQQSLRRSSDPSGKTLPPGFAVRKAEDLAPLLPAGIPRFKAGVRPLPGVDWELVELLGTGGFAEVWKAKNPHFDGVPPVALKFCLDASARALKHEAEVLNQIMRHGNHPGIVGLKHTYLGANPPCLEYEYVHGGDLTALIRQWALKGGAPPRQAATIIQELAEIVGFAHQLDPPMVHRDLKPSNVLVERCADGTIRFRIADFGIGGLAAQQAIKRATRLGTAGNQRRNTIVRGSFTPLYASPQQVRGESPDPRDDVYALGMIWYQLLSGDLLRERPSGSAWKNELQARGMTERMIHLLALCLEELRDGRPANALGAAYLIQYELGRESLELGKFDAAIIALNQAVQILPYEYCGHAVLGYAFAAKEMWDDAIDSWKRAIALNKEDLGSLHNLAYAYSEKGMYKEAIDILTEVVQKDEDRCESFLLMGYVYGEMGRWDDAIASLTCSIELRSDPRDYTARAEAFCSSGEYRLAVSDCSKALSLDAGCYDALLQRSWAQYKNGNIDGAVADMDLIIRRKPRHCTKTYGKEYITYAFAYYQRAWFFQYKGDRERFHMDRQKALELDPPLQALDRYYESEMETGSDDR